MRYANKKSALQRSHIDAFGDGAWCNIPVKSRDKTWSSALQFLGFPHCFPPPAFPAPGTGNNNLNSKYLERHNSRILCHFHSYISKMDGLGEVKWAQIVILCIYITALRAPSVCAILKQHIDKKKFRSKPSLLTSQIDRNLLIPL